ncbi:HET-domain-containing protein [Xylariaceae sp. FL1019]|nr:HET-domain-containing protein [Xylariaceae sp. FL1019]
MRSSGKILYSDLNPKKRALRLLNVLPCSGPLFEQIPCCQLITTTLKEAPSYNALSYAWGDPEKNRVILIDGEAVYVPKNVFEALIGTRPSDTPFLLGTPFLLWIDFLCINQECSTEKSWQVSMMGDIYFHANEVLVWLGRGGRRSRRGMQFLDSLGKEAFNCGFYHNIHAAQTQWRELYTIGRVNPNEQPVGLRMPLRTKASGDQNPLLDRRSKSLFHKLDAFIRDGSFPLQDMRCVLHRPWFERVWVLQEIARSKRATFVCGSTKMDMERLSAAMNAYVTFIEAIRGSTKESNKKLTRLEVELCREFFFRSMTMADSRRIALALNFPLIALLRLTCVGSPNHDKHGPHHLNSTDPRDKIFAILGLATDRYDLLRRGLKPDYTKSCRDVYIRATCIMLQQGHLSLLSSVQPGRSPAHELPSWVPDWSQPLTEPLQICKDDHLTWEPRFYASGTENSSPRAKVNFDNSVIHGISLSGFLCDEVLCVGDFPGRKTSWDVLLEETNSWPRQWLAEVLRLSYRSKREFPSFRERLLAAARAASGGTTLSFTGDLVRSGAELLGEGIELLRASIRHLRHPRIEREAQRFLDKTQIEEFHQPLKASGSRLTNDIIGKSLKRLPFVTSKGRLGLSYDNIKAGDVVAILKGCEVPFVLRPQQSKEYSLVSEAYVDGIMDGEALAGARFVWLHIV